MVKVDSNYDVSIVRNKAPGFEIEGVTGWHVKNTVIGAKYLVSANDVYRGARTSSLESGYTFVEGSGAGHPIRIQDSQGNVVAKVTKYVGIQRSILARLAANNLNINNPDGGTPPVVITFNPNLTYTTYEGFPWKDANSRNVFALESDINLAVDFDSNQNPQKTFYLNWVRTDSPADIIMQLSISAIPDHYATADVRIVNESGGYYGMYEGIRYDLGTSESDADGKKFIVIYESPTVSDTYTVIIADTPEAKKGLIDGVSKVDLDADVWYCSKTGTAVSKDANNKYTVNAGHADENGFIVLYKEVNDDKYVVLKVGDSVTSAETNLSVGDRVTGVEGWYIGDRVLHGDYYVDPTPYYHVDVPLEVIPGFAPKSEVSNGGNIVVYESANPAATYDVVMVGDSTVEIERDRTTSSDPISLTGTWYVKGRAITSYKVDASDADEGGYIVLYQTAAAAGKYNVVKVGNNSLDIVKGQSADVTVDVVNGWHVKGRTVGAQYTIDAGDSYTSGMGDNGECYIWDSSELHLKVPVSYDSKLKILITYEKDKAWYALNDTTFGYKQLTYDENPVTGSVIWGNSLILPDTFDGKAGDQSVSDVEIEMWVAGLPNGENISITKTGGQFVYEFTKADSLKTSNFIYTARNTDVTGFVKEVLQDSRIKFFISSDNVVYNAETREPVSVKFYTDRTCTVEHAYVPDPEKVTTDTIYVDSKIIFTPLKSSTFVTLSFSTYFGEFDFNSSKMISATLPAGGTMKEYARNIEELMSVSRFLTTYSTGDWEYVFGGFYWGDVPLDLEDDQEKITGNRSYIAVWTPNESNEKSFSYRSDGNANISAIRDAVVAESVTEGETKRFVVDTEITMAIRPEAGYVIDLDKTRGELGYMLVGTEIYVDVTTASAPAGSGHSFSSWKLWDSGSPVRANYQITEMGDSAKNGFLVYIANWTNASAHAGSIALIFVTDESINANAIYANAGDTKTIPDGTWKIWNKNNVTDADADGTNGLQYTVDAKDAVDGYIIFVKDRMVLTDYTAVFATEYGDVSKADNLDYYYKDANGNKYYKVDVDKVYRYEVENQVGHWEEYTVTNLAGTDGLFIVQFSTDNISYKVTREGLFYRATPIEYTVTEVDGSGLITKFAGNEHTYVVVGGVIKDETGKKVQIKLFTDKKLINRIDLTTYKTLKDAKIYSGNYVECDPVHGFFTSRLEGTSVQGWMSESDIVSDVNGWKVGGRTIDEYAYVVSEVDVDAGGFIVLYKAATSQNKYVVIKVDITDLEHPKVDLTEPLDPTAPVEGVDGWFVKGRAISTQYRVDAADADAGGFIVLYKAPTSQDEYVVIKVDITDPENPVASLTEPLVSGTEVKDVDGWYVNGEVISNPFKVKSADADAGRFIVIYRGYVNKENEYTVVLVDGSSVSLIRELSNGDSTHVTGVKGWKVGNTLIETDAYTVSSAHADLGGFIVLHKYDNPTGKYTVVKLDDGLTYYATKAEAKSGSGTPTPTANLSYAKPNDVVETYMYSGLVHYQLTPYGSEYMCFETNILQYGITPSGSQLKDTYDTVWSKNNSGELSVVSTTYWEIDPTTNVETSRTITDLSLLPAQYYLKDSFGNYYKGNYFANNSLTIYSLDLYRDSTTTEYFVKYISDNEYVKALYSNSSKTGDPIFLIKRNGDLVNYGDKSAASGILYYHGTKVAYNGDYSIVSTVSKYSTDTEVRINDIVYHKDSFGNLYYDWLGSPTELPGNRGYSWTFLLKDDLDMTIYMKEVSYNINFVINGKKVNATDLYAISTVNTMNSGISDARNKSVDDKVDLDSGNWYKYVSGVISPVTKDPENRYTVASEDALQRFILLYKTANTPGTYTVIKVDANATTMYRGMTAGEKIQLDDKDWYSYKDGEKVDKDEETKKYTISGDDVVNGFIVLYRAVPTGYTVLKVDDAKDYKGDSIKQYTVVAFDGPQSNRGITWYTDPDYKNEYTGFGDEHVISPDMFEVDLMTPVAMTASTHTFGKWSLFGSNTILYNPVQSVVLTGGSQHLGNDTKNFFYIIEATWETHGTGTYKIVYASQYKGIPDSNLEYKSNAFTLKSITGDGFKGWKVWNQGDLLTGGTSYTPSDSDAVVINGSKYILLVADWGEDLTYANNIVYASEYGEAPKMESIRKYQFNATRNITLYAHTGTYVVYLHSFDDEREPMKFELVADENYRITIPNDHYGYNDYVFVGWSAFTEGGKRVYTYAPEESINISALEERIDLYPFYVSDGTDVKYYDGQTSTLKVGMDDVLRSKQKEPDTSILRVSYSDTPVTEYDPSSPTSPLDGTHAGDYYIYYAAEIKTPLGWSTPESKYGNTEEAYSFYGKSTLKIMKIDAYVVAPSVYVREGDGKIIAASSPGSIYPSDMTGTNVVITSEDVTLIGLVIFDVDSMKLYTSDSDKSTGMPRTELDDPSDTIVIRPLVAFTTEEAPYATTDYNLKYIDGELTIYPEDASKYEAEGHI